MAKTRSPGPKKAGAKPHDGANLSKICPRGGLPIVANRSNLSGGGGIELRSPSAILARLAEIARPACADAILTLGSNPRLRSSSKSVVGSNLVVSV